MAASIRHTLCRTQQTAPGPWLPSSFNTLPSPSGVARRAADRLAASFYIGGSFHRQPGSRPHIAFKSFGFGLPQPAQLNARAQWKSVPGYRLFQRGTSSLVKSCAVGSTPDANHSRLKGSRGQGKGFGMAAKLQHIVRAAARPRAADRARRAGEYEDGRCSPLRWAPPASLKGRASLQGIMRALDGPGQTAPMTALTHRSTTTAPGERPNDSAGIDVIVHHHHSARGAGGSRHPRLTLQHGPNRRILEESNGKTH